MLRCFEGLDVPRSGSLVVMELTGSAAAYLDHKAFAVAAGDKGHLLYMLTPCNRTDLCVYLPLRLTRGRALHAYVRFKLHDGAYVRHHVSCRVYS
jgi:hypothetical protein